MSPTAAPITFILIDKKPEHFATFAQAEKVRDQLKNATGKRYRVMKVLNCPGEQAERIIRQEQQRKVSSS